MPFPVAWLTQPSERRVQLLLGDISKVPPELGRCAQSRGQAWVSLSRLTAVHLAGGGLSAPTHTGTAPPRKGGGKVQSKTSLRKFPILHLALRANPHAKVVPYHVAGG